MVLKGSLRPKNVSLFPVEGLEIPSFVVVLWQNYPLLTNPLTPRHGEGRRGC